MNLELLNPFAQDFPESFESSIEAYAQCTRFNPRGLFAGHFLAVGRQDGAVAILDFETKGIVRYFEGHVKAVTTVCWSRNSRYLLTASRDWNVIIWDLSSQAQKTPEGERRSTVRFDAPITSANLHPRNSNLLVVTQHSQVEPVFVDLREGKGGTRWYLETEKVPNEEDEEEDEEEEDEEDSKYKEISTLARFNPRGDLIYVGTSRGNIHIFDVETKAHLHTEWTGSSSAIKHMEFSPKGTALVINSNDRCIRVINLLPKRPHSHSQSGSEAGEDEGDVTMKEDRSESTKDEPVEPKEAQEEEPFVPTRIPEFDYQHRFQDLVNRTPWNGCGFSRDGEYIIGGAGHKASHNIYIWDRESGGLLKILEGPKDPLDDIDWHPIRPLIASVSSLGLIHIWVTGITENWGAYAPGFEELEENMEYPEKEDEFDIEDESVIKQRKADEQDRPVDIMSVPRARSASPSNFAPIDPEYAIDYSEYEHFISQGPDEDLDEGFYPQPELFEYVEEEDVVLPMSNGAPAQNGGADADDSGNASEELGLPVEDIVRPVKRKGKKGKS